MSAIVTTATNTSKNTPLSPLHSSNTLNKLEGGTEEEPLTLATSMGNNDFILAKTQKKKILASGYTRSKRFMEITCITLFCFMLGINFYLVLPYLKWELLLTILLASFCGILLADFISGVIHWAADTWGTVEWPIVGNTFIRSFREHHVDPSAMTKHDFIETNGDNCLIATVFCLIPHIKCSPNIITLFSGAAVTSNAMAGDQIFSMFMWTFLAIFASLTNQFHKWAHMYKPPTFVQYLQHFQIILSRRNHNIHHKSPFDRNYCITTGWLNPVFEYTGFWRHLEKAISCITGLVPRQDDATWNDHLNLLVNKNNNINNNEKKIN